MLTLSGTFTPEEMLDVLAYILATNPATSGVEWILGDVGMGTPTQEPFGYISLFNEQVLWMTANGGRGGLSAGGVNGLDDWQDVVLLTIGFAKHSYVPPVQAAPPANGPTNPAQLGSLPPYQEQPTWRLAIQLAEQIKFVMRQNIVLAGSVATTRVSEWRPVLLNLQGAMYRALRVTVQAQRRQSRGGGSAQQVTGQVIPVGPPRFTDSRTVAWSGPVVVASGATGFIPPFREPVDSDVTKNVVGVWTSIRHGISATVAVNQNGVAIPGLGALVVTPTATFTPASAAIANGDSFAVVVSGVTGSEDGLSVSLVVETIQQS